MKKHSMRNKVKNIAGEKIRHKTGNSDDDDDDRLTIMIMKIIIIIIIITNSLHNKNAQTSIRNIACIV